MAQINAYLSRQVRRDFKIYAKSVGLDAAELARLLFVREMLVRRFEALSLQGKTLSSASRGQHTEKLTAHFHRKKDVTNFDIYAKKLKLKRSIAAKFIVETELKEKWLLRAFRWSPE